MDDSRLLPPELIPPSLWIASEGVLLFPSHLRSAYVNLLEELGLTHLANDQPETGAVGGEGSHETDYHFAQAFSGSVARVLLAVLDPKNEVGDASDAFIRCTSGPSVCITDAPCGSGAAAAALLCAIAELRAEGVIPRQRLAVKLIGAELSPTARVYAEKMMRRVIPFLEEQAIFLEFEFKEWDVTCEISTTNLVKACVLGADKVESKLLMIANFSGFLSLSGKRKDSERQLGELFRYASADNSFAVWLEPNTNKVTNDGGLFPWLQKILASTWAPFARLAQRWKRTSAGMAENSLPGSEAKFRHPLRDDDLVSVRLRVVAMTLEQSV